MAVEVADVVEVLLAQDEPSVVLAVRRDILGESDADLADVGEEVRNSSRARTLIAGVPIGDVYDKWHGAHWVLADLADLGYPRGARELEPLRDRVADQWLADSYYVEYEAKSKASAYGREGVAIMEGRHRRCGSQQGNALRSMVQLGLADERADKLAERLVHWQWPDGGWNCDRNPSADTSSFMETLTPMRGLAAYARLRNHKTAGAAARAAAEVFLSRGLFRRRSDGTPIQPSFLKLHHPLYWHYDILRGLVAMAELGLLGDERCAAALNLLESKRLADGGWTAEAKFYSTSIEPVSGSTAVNWRGSGPKRMNPWVTVQALRVLLEAGRLRR
ncbi:MAG: hypothetical protein ACXWH0_12520 [Acidimicrobiia bacterium]